MGSEQRRVKSHGCRLCRGVSQLNKDLKIFLDLWHHQELKECSILFICLFFQSFGLSLSVQSSQSLSFWLRSPSCSLMPIYISAVSILSKLWVYYRAYYFFFWNTWSWSHDHYFQRPLNWISWVWSVAQHLIISQWPLNNEDCRLDTIISMFVATDDGLTSVNIPTNIIIKLKPQKFNATNNIYVPKPNETSVQSAK